VTTIAARWGVDPPNPVPADLADYLLVFPESDPRLGDVWVHFRAGDPRLSHARSRIRETASGRVDDACVPHYLGHVPDREGGSGSAVHRRFLNGGGMVWQLLNSALFSEFRGFAAVGKVLDPEKVRHYRRQLASAGTQPEPAPVAYIHGTADRGYRPPFTLEEAELDVTLPAFTMAEMLERNAIPSNAPATTQLVPGTNGVSDVVVQPLRRNGSVPDGHRDQRRAQLADPDYAREPARGRPFRRDRGDRPVLASACGIALTAGPSQGRVAPCTGAVASAIELRSTTDSASAIHSLPSDDATRVRYIEGCVVTGLAWPWQGEWVLPGPDTGPWAGCVEIADLEAIAALVKPLNPPTHTSADDTKPAVRRRCRRRNGSTRGGRRRTRRGSLVEHQQRRGTAAVSRAA
jgi:hypothetical protein